MGAGASATKAPGEESPSWASAGVPELLTGTNLEVLAPEQQQQFQKLATLLEEPGWKRGSRRRSVAVHYKYSEDTGLYYVCSSCSVPDSARNMFEDFDGGCAQQRYNEVCREEQVLEVVEQEPPLGHLRLVRGVYAMPSPMKDRDFVWREWAALLPLEDGGQLYISVAFSPEDEASLCPAEPQRFVRGHLHLAATIARQRTTESQVSAASIILGDVKGSLPKSLQNMVAGNASSYLANFRDAHTPPARG